MYPLLDEATMSVEQVRERLEVFADARFRFEAGPHAYWLGARRLTSATSLVKKLHKPFDAAAQAPRTAAKRGVSTAEVLAEWAYAGVMGSLTHDYIEHEYPRWYHGDRSVLHVPYPADEEATHRIRKFQDLRALRLLGLEPVGQEIRLWHEPSGLSGTLDLLAYHHPTRRLLVGDYKTSREIRTDADPFWEHFYAPFADLKVNQLNEYSLQVGVYRLFLEFAGIPTSGGFIMHLPPGDAPGAVIPTKDFRDRLRYLFAPVGVRANEDRVEVTPGIILP